MWERWVDVWSHLFLLRKRRRITGSQLPRSRILGVVTRAAARGRPSHASLQMPSKGVRAAHKKKTLDQTKGVRGINWHKIVGGSVPTPGLGVPVFPSPLLGSGSVFACYACKSSVQHHHSTDDSSVAFLGVFVPSLHCIRRLPRDDEIACLALPAVCSATVHTQSSSNGKTNNSSTSRMEY